MIWKLVKYYNTSNEKLIKEFTSFENAVKLYNALNTETNNLRLEIFFEDLVYSNIKQCWENCKFTIRNNNGQ